MPDRETICEKHLTDACKRIKMPLPNQRYRGNHCTRNLARMHEIVDYLDGQDPRSYTDITDWFKGKKVKVGKADGRQVWLDLQRHCGLEPVPYDQIPNGCGTLSGKLKLSIEHWVKQCMAGDRNVFINGIAWLDALEFGINNTAEFKHFDSLAQEAMIGSKATLVRRRQLAWTNTGDNHLRPSFHFFLSTQTMDLDIQPMIYLSSGRRVGTLSVQSNLSFSPANYTRAAVAGARVTEDAVAEPDTSRRIVEVKHVSTQTEVHHESALEEALRKANARIRELEAMAFAPVAPTAKRPAPPTPRAKPAAAKKAKPSAAPASADGNDVPPPFELVKKSKEAYAATLAKLGVAKVCNMAYRPTGSYGPFTLCETTTGLTKDSTCSVCKRTRRGVEINHGSKVARNGCPCNAGGTRCLHTKGATKKGMPMSGYCGTCKAGKCTPEYHALGKHFPKPPSTSAQSTAATAT